MFFLSILSNPVHAFDWFGMGQTDTGGVDRPRVIGSTPSSKGMQKKIKATDSWFDSFFGQESTPPRQLQNIMNPDNVSTLGSGDSSPVQGVRKKAVQQAAQTLGARWGLYWKYQRIKRFLLSIERRLDRTVNFDRVTLNDGRVLPPVIERVNQSRSFSEDEMVRTDVTWKIRRDAQFVSRTPTWRSYLFKDDVIQKPNGVYVNLIPENNDEQSAWKNGVQSGWKAGVQQAERIFRRSLNRMKRDYTGMLRFRKLVEKGLVSVPVIESNRPGKRIPGIRLRDDRLDIGQKVFSIKMPSSFQPVPKWEPNVLDEESFRGEDLGS